MVASEAVNNLNCKGTFPGQDDEAGAITSLHKHAYHYLVDVIDTPDQGQRDDMVSGLLLPMR